ncbi:hypothetical protein AYO41_02960 [Verrucomicrobia bacterium SCGC AG-212-E04]|nr:hypothetical protein AYO41_02960 [Verrucomicrobia bacterium SCGC AG-212-E04]
MKTFEERHAAWLDGRLNESERAIFERELVEQHRLDPEAERAALDRLNVALRGHLAQTRMPNPDFFNHRLLERIESDRRALEPKPVPVASHHGLGWLALFGATALVLGLAMYRGMIFPQLEERPETVYLTQVLDAKSPAPEVHASSFNANAKDEQAAVLWLDGMSHVPESYAAADENLDPDAVP